MFVSKRKGCEVRVLFVEHDHVSPIGPVGARFAAHGYDISELLVVPAHRHHEPGVTVEFPEPSAYDVVVAMGAPWSVYDAELIGSWVEPELAFLRSAHEAGVPVLGICFGGQALAAALGGAVVRAERSEIGWVTIRTENPDLVEAGPWFQWHHDKWVSPPGARVLAATSVCEQAFVIGHSLAVQFHPELTPRTLRGWLGKGGATYLAEHGYDADALLARTDTLADAAEERAHRLVDRFLAHAAAAVTVPGAPGRAS
jgi:GMP synthase-like glutamine amidotransferase